jgi:putative membrane protein
MAAFRRLAAAAAFASFALAPIAAAQSPSNPPPPPAQPTTVAVPFLQVAGESDVYEVTAAQIAAMRAQNPMVRAFAEMMIAHHTETTNLALQQARASGVMAPPPVLGAATRTQIDQLLNAPAAGFDRLYLQQQVNAHRQALALHTAYARSGDNPELRRAAATIAPLVAEHLRIAEALAAELDG